MAADDINIAEEAFRKYDEHVIEDDPLDHKIHHSFSELYKVPMSDQIFVAQSNVRGFDETDDVTTPLFRDWMDIYFVE